MRSTKFAALICAAVLVLMSMSACSKSETAKTNSSNADSSSAKSTDKKLDVYLSSNGTPYYLADDGTKMNLYAYADEDDDTSEDEAAANYIYDKYDADGLKFDIPEGWFADTSFGSPMLLQQADSDDEINYDESIAIVDTENVFDSDNGKVTKKTVKSYFDNYLDYGYYTDYKISETGSMKVSGVDANYYDVITTISSTLTNTDSDEDAEPVVCKTRYIITDEDTSHCMILSALNNDESFGRVVEAYEKMADSLELPS